VCPAPPRWTCGNLPVNGTWSQAGGTVSSSQCRFDACHSHSARAPYRLSVLSSQAFAHCEDKVRHCWPIQGQLSPRACMRIVGPLRSWKRQPTRSPLCMEVLAASAPALKAWSTRAASLTHLRAQSRWSMIPHRCSWATRQLTRKCGW